MEFKTEPGTRMNNKGLLQGHFGAVGPPGDHHNMPFNPALFSGLSFNPPINNNSGPVFPGNQSWSDNHCQGLGGINPFNPFNGPPEMKHSVLLQAASNPSQVLFHSQQGPRLGLVGQNSAGLQGGALQLSQMPQLTSVVKKIKEEGCADVLHKILAHDDISTRKVGDIREFVETQLLPNLADPEKIFHTLCFFLEQTLFALVDWARNADYFRVIAVEDQMQLLNSSWSEILLMEFIYHSCSPEHLDITWQSADIQSCLEVLDILGLRDVRSRLMEMRERIYWLQMDKAEFAALKMLLLFNGSKHDVSLRRHREYIDKTLFKVSAALMQYCGEHYPEQPDKFGRILLRLPELKHMTIKLEAYLMEKFRAGVIPRNTLIAEMLVSKTKSLTLSNPSQ